MNLHSLANVAEREQLSSPHLHYPTARLGDSGSFFVRIRHVARSAFPAKHCGSRNLYVDRDVGGSCLSSERKVWAVRDFSVIIDNGQDRQKEKVHSGRRTVRVLVNDANVETKRLYESQVSYGDTKENRKWSVPNIISPRTYELSHVQRD